MQQSTWPHGYKTFFMLNSTEHEIYPTRKIKTLNFFKDFMLNSNSIMQINAKMPTNVGILTFMSLIFMLSCCV